MHERLLADIAPVAGKALRVLRRSPGGPETEPDGPYGLSGLLPSRTRDTGHGDRHIGGEKLGDAVGHGAGALGGDCPDGRIVENRAGNAEGMLLDVEHVAHDASGEGIGRTGNLGERCGDEPSRAGLGAGKAQPAATGSRERRFCAGRDIS